MKKLNTRGFSHVEMFLTLIVVVVIGALGFYAFNSIKDRSSQAESGEKATPEQLAFTPAEKAAADAEPEASRTTIFNQNGVNLRVCRYPRDGWWGINMAGFKTIDAERRIIVFNVNRNRWTTKFVLQRSDRSQTSHYGQTKSGYIKFLVGQTGAYRVLKFNTLAVC